MMGLGSIIGTGVFVAIGLGAELAGVALMGAIALAAVLATCNALSSAQLAASHPVSGGTYEYGYRYLRPVLGFSAGWMFLCAKTASAATAALGFAGYLLKLLDVTLGSEIARIAIATLVIVVLTVVVLGGIRLSNRANVFIVSITLFTLLAFIASGAKTLMDRWGPMTAIANHDSTHEFWPSFLQATALMFVAFTGYGRIATLGEEVRDPRNTIPRAIVTTLWISTAIYIAVAAIALAAVDPSDLGQATRSHAAPLELVASRFGVPGIQTVIAFGAMTAMLGVLLNLILGLSRVWLAMGRRGDMPAPLARLNAAQTTPYVAVIVVALSVLALACIGNVKATWSFSAFTVLIYYAITNAAALALPKAERLYRPWIAVAGLAGCLSLAFWVDRNAWIAGVIVLGVGLVWFLLVHQKDSPTEVGPPEED